jgi:preprotein translocase subunit SecG
MWQVELLRTVVAIVLFIVSVLLIVVVLLQQSKGEGLGSIGGGGRLFHGAQSGLDVFLNKATTYVAIAFMALALLATAINIFV